MFSVWCMTISVMDSGAAMARILDATPDSRADLVREMWAPMAGMYSFIPSGVDFADVHRQTFGFDWDEPGSRVRDGLEALRVADAWNRVQTALDMGAAAIRSADPGASIPDLTVLLVLGDPGNEHFMREVQGLSAFGGISGFISLTVWPTDRVLRRLESIAVHELHHNVRYSPGGVVWDPATVTLGEQVIAEGLADTFATELFGDDGLSHFVAQETRLDDAVLARVANGLGVTGMHNFAAWILGDSTARVLGGEPMGLPTGAGYAAGVRLVDAYLKEAGGTAASNVRTPASQILGPALTSLGLPAATQN